MSEAAPSRIGHIPPREIPAPAPAQPNPQPTPLALIVALANYLKDAAAYGRIRRWTKPQYPLRNEKVQQRQAAFAYNAAEPGSKRHLPAPSQYPFGGGWDDEKQAIFERTANADLAEVDAGRLAALWWLSDYGLSEPFPHVLDLIADPAMHPSSELTMTTAALQRFVAHHLQCTPEQAGRGVSELLCELVRMGEMYPPRIPDATVSPSRWQQPSGPPDAEAWESHWLCRRLVGIRFSTFNVLNPEFKAGNLWAVAAPADTYRKTSFPARLVDTVTTLLRHVRVTFKRR